MRAASPPFIISMRGIGDTALEREGAVVAGLGSGVLGLTSVRSCDEVPAGSAAGISGTCTSGSASFYNNDPSHGAHTHEARIRGASRARAEMRLADYSAASRSGGRRADDVCRLPRIDEETYEECVDEELIRGSARASSTRGRSGSAEALDQEGERVGSVRLPPLAASKASTRSLPP